MKPKDIQYVKYIVNRYIHNKSCGTYVRTLNKRAT